MPTATWTAPAQLQQIAPLRRQIVHYAGGQCVANPPLDDLRLAASEAITNCVVHAFRGVQAGTITASLRVGAPGEELELVIADDGTGMAPRTDSPGLGVGMTIIRTIARAVSVGVPPCGHGTELRMTFATARP